MMATTTKQVLDSLVVPAAFSRHDSISDPTVLAELYTWKSSTETLLGHLDLFDVSTHSISEQADLVRVLAPLTATAQWSSPLTRSLACARLAIVPPSRQLITHTLTYIVKPLFAPTPHPRLHTSTARILSRPADTQDTYIEQPWKEHPGLDEVIRWCLLNTESSAYEIAWPLFLPPVMTFLDDYQVPYKLLGIRLVSEMLRRVPPDLLLRTGVDTLLFTSLTHSLSHLGDKSTPDFIHLAVSTTLQLIDLTTPSVLSTTCVSPLVDQQRQSQSLSTRFSRLSTLLSTSLLGTVIMYSPTFLPPPSASSGADPDPFADPAHTDADSGQAAEDVAQDPAPQRQQLNPTLVAAAQSLPSVLSALGIGGTRFLKGVIPVLAEWLALPLSGAVVQAENDTTGGVTAPIETDRLASDSQLEPDSRASTTEVALHLASLASMSVLLCTCTPRIKRWVTTIVDALGRCWIGCLDVESCRGGNNISKASIFALKQKLRETAIQLAEKYPEVIENEYGKLMDFDGPVFRGLVGEV